MYLGGCMCISQSLSDVRLFCNPVDCNPPGSSVHGILQARILEWVAISFSRGSSGPRDWTRISYTGKQILYHWAWEALRYLDRCINVCFHLKLNLNAEDNSKFTQLLFFFPTYKICKVSHLKHEIHVKRPKNTHGWDLEWDVPGVRGTSIFRFQFFKNSCEFVKTTSPIY